MANYLATIGGEFRFTKTGDTVLVTSYEHSDFTAEYEIPETVDLDSPEMAIEEILYSTFYDDVLADYQEQTS